jgi:hypothetical protein
MVTEDEIIKKYVDLFWRYMPFIERAHVEDAIRDVIKHIRKLDETNAPKLTPTVTFTSNASGVIIAQIPFKDISGMLMLGTWHPDKNKGTFRIGPQGETPSEFLGGSTGYVNDFNSWLTLMQTFSRA